MKSGSHDLPEEGSAYRWSLRTEREFVAGLYNVCDRFCVTGAGGLVGCCPAASCHRALRTADLLEAFAEAKAEWRSRTAGRQGPTYAVELLDEIGVTIFGAVAVVPDPDHAEFRPHVDGTRAPWLLTRPEWKLVRAAAKELGCAGGSRPEVSRTGPQEGNTRVLGGEYSRARDELEQAAAQLQSFGDRGVRQKHYLEMVAAKIQLTRIERITSFEERFAGLSEPVRGYVMFERTERFAPDPHRILAEITAAFLHGVARFALSFRDRGSAAAAPTYQICLPRDFDHLTPCPRERRDTVAVAPRPGRSRPPASLGHYEEMRQLHAVLQREPHIPYLVSRFVEEGLDALLARAQAAGFDPDYLQSPDGGTCCHILFMCKPRNEQGWRWLPTPPQLEAWRKAYVSESSRSLDKTLDSVSFTVGGIIGRLCYLGRALDYVRDFRSEKYLVGQGYRIGLLGDEASVGKMPMVESKLPGLTDKDGRQAPYFYFSLVDPRDPTTEEDRSVQGLVVLFRMPPAIDDDPALLGLRSALFFGAYRLVHQWRQQLDVIPAVRSVLTEAISKVVEAEVRIDQQQLMLRSFGHDASRPAEWLLNVSLDSALSEKEQLSGARWLARGLLMRLRALPSLVVRGEERQELLASDWRRSRQRIPLGEFWRHQCVLAIFGIVFRKGASTVREMMWGSPPICWPSKQRSLTTELWREHFRDAFGPLLAHAGSDPWDDKGREALRQAYDTLSEKHILDCGADVECDAEFSVPVSLQQSEDERFKRPYPLCETALGFIFGEVIQNHIQHTLGRRPLIAQLCAQTMDFRLRVERHERGADIVMIMNPGDAALPRKPLKRQRAPVGLVSLQMAAEALGAQMGPMIEWRGAPRGKAPFPKFGERGNEWRLAGLCLPEAYWS